MATFGQLFTVLNSVVHDLLSLADAILVLDLDLATVDEGPDHHQVPAQHPLIKGCMISLNKEK